MKDEDSTPFEPVGDESLEARIVAWVLGDASAFEAVELERLCEERPELLVFRRRMQALHGLLTEDEAAQPDEAWKLPADKRGKIEALFGEMHAAAPEVTVLATPKRRYQPWIRQTLIASAACLALAAGFHQVFKPQSDHGVAMKMSQAPRDVDFMPSGGGAGQAGAGRGSAPRSSLPASPNAQRFAAKGASSSFVLPEPESSEGIASVGSLQGNGGLSGGGLGGSGSGGGRGDGTGRGFGSAAAPAKPDTTLATRDQEQAVSRVPSPAPAPTIAPGQFGSARGGRAAGAPAARASGYVGSDDQIAWSDADVPQPNVVTEGNRSGDGTISRNSIDAVLNNPNRPGAAAPPVDAFAKNEDNRRFKFAVQDEGKKAQLGDGPQRAKPGEKAMQDGGEIVDAKKAAAEPAPSGGVEGEIHIGASSDYIFRGSDQGHGLAEAGADVSKEVPKNDISDLETLGKLSKTAGSAGPDHYSELDIYGEVSKDHGFAAGNAGGAWYGSIEDSNNPATPFGSSTTTLNYRYSLSTGAPADSTFQGQGPSELGLDGQAPKKAPSMGWLLSADGTKTDSANRADVAKAKSAPDTSIEEVRYKMDVSDAPVAAADPFAAPVPTGAGAKDQLADRGDAKPKVEIVREFQYPTEYESPELPNGAPQAADAGRSGLAQREIIRRQEAVAGSDELIARGKAAEANGDLQAARDSYDAALNKLPAAPVLEKRREEVAKLLEDVAKNEPQQAQTKEGKDTLRTNPALSYEHTSDVEKARKGLYMGEGNFNLGKYDDAKRDFEEVLRVDPYNSAARRGMERVNAAKSDYYRAAYDHTRAELLMQVDKAWELETPEALKKAIAEKESRIAQASDQSGAKQEAKINKALENQERTELAELKAKLAAATATPAKPKPAPVPTDETSATEEPFSTFSLHVSDASFKLAKAALDRGDRPSPDQIRIEEFYNAFDYGDPSPAPGEQVACAIEQGAHPVLPQRNIVRVGMRVGSSGRSAGQPLNLTVLLDNSGSMEREDRNAGLKAAVAQLASLLKPGDTVTLAGFSRTPHLLADRLPGADAKKLIELVDKLPSEGGTNLEEALKLAGELAIQRRNPAAQNRIVLLTDGAANLGNAQPEELSNKVAELRQQGIAFDAAGICAGGLNDRMLEALTRNGNGRYYIVNSPADADANFARQLAGAFRPAAENVKVQVHFNPARVARYKLIGFEKHRLNKEDFHNDKVDAAELAADEAGVALYQVETLPQGTGEIGEVSVRFRDTSSGEMVERTWTIPHDEKTPAFDKASPSIQLATLAALAAEKLRGGPLADATDFSSLVPQVARVRAYYANSSRVGELVDMTGKLK